MISEIILKLEMSLPTGISNIIYTYIPDTHNVLNEFGEITSYTTIGGQKEGLSLDYGASGLIDFLRFYHKGRTGGVFIIYTNGLVLLTEYHTGYDEEDFGHHSLE